MPDPVTAASTFSTWGPPVLSFLGNALSGLGQSKAAKEQAAQQARQAAQQAQLGYSQLGQGDRQYGQSSNLERTGFLDQRALQAAQLRNQMNRMPLADRASAMLAARAGAAPAPFQARDYTRGVTPGSGQATGGMGDVLTAQRTAAQSYTPGAGGMMNNPELQAAISRLTSMAGVPEEYKPQNPARARLEAALAEQMNIAATAKLDRNRKAALEAVARIRQQLAQLGG